MKPARVDLSVGESAVLGREGERGGRVDDEELDVEGDMSDDAAVEVEAEAEREAEEERDGAVRGRRTVPDGNELDEGEKRGVVGEKADAADGVGGTGAREK